MGIDYESLAASLSSLAGLPVRLYRDGEFAGLYHHTRFKPDLAVLEEGHIFATPGNVSYYMDENFLYYGLFRAERGAVADELGNVIIIKEASKGYENHEPVMLQGHMDMVAVKRPDSPVDMTKDGLILSVDGDRLFAEGTSLGGDDGIAVAYGLALLDGSYRHPRIELVITVDEEVGMDGARGLDAAPLKAKRLVNLDSEEEGIFLSGCAGGARVNMQISGVWESKKGVPCEIRVGGLKGGHSGGEIHKERGNANSLAGRLLEAVSKVTKIGICEMDGGLADNAIPREVVLRFIVSEKEDELEEAVRAFEKKLRTELSTKDPGVRIEMAKETDAAAYCLDSASCEKVKKLLLIMPNGIQAMSADMHGLVQTSLNNGIMKLGEKELNVITSVRSSVASEKEALITRITAITELLGGCVEVTGDYPGWTYQKESPFRDLCIKVYEEMYGKSPKIQAIHAGVECGILLEKRPDLDCISLGPDMKDIHTTEEKLSVSSAKRVFEYVCRILAEK